MEIYIKKLDFHISSFFWFQLWFCHIHWFYPCCSFKYSKWWRQKL